MMARGKPWYEETKPLKALRTHEVHRHWRRPRGTAGMCVSNYFFEDVALPGKYYSQYSVLSSYEEDLRVVMAYYNAGDTYSLEVKWFPSIHAPLNPNAVVALLATGPQKIHCSFMKAYVREADSIQYCIGSIVDYTSTSVLQ